MCDEKNKLIKKLVHKKGSVISIFEQFSHHFILIYNNLLIILDLILNIAFFQSW